MTFSVCFQPFLCHCRHCLLQLPLLCNEIYVDDFAGRYSIFNMNSAKMATWLREQLMRQNWHVLYCSVGHKRSVPRDSVQPCHCPSFHHLQEKCWTCVRESSCPLHTSIWYGSCQGYQQTCGKLVCDYQGLHELCRWNNKIQRMQLLPFDSLQDS